jgi:hypothetical protein
VKRPEQQGEWRKWSGGGGVVLVVIIRVSQALTTPLSLTTLLVVDPLKSL